jgi:glycerol-3-phosphate acyltransferase PlsX
MMASDGPMRIAVDAMGGDMSPREVIGGTLDALREAGGKYEAVLLGDRAVTNGALREARDAGLAVSAVEASDVIEMHESPALAIRKKKNSPIALAMRMQKAGDVSALVSAGNTGAIMAFALTGVGRLKGVARPAIAALLPSETGFTLLLDVGANSDCKPNHLFQFALMGSIYVKSVLEIEDPRVGLMSIGEESSKGNELTLRAHELIGKSGVNFVGNIEGRDILMGGVDVVVCDGFVGNVVLKFGESIIDIFSSSIKEMAQRDARSRLGSLLLAPGFRRLKKRLDYEEYGGAPLLGVDGVVIICHGSSSAKAIKNAIGVAERCVTKRVNDQIKGELRRQGDERSRNG